ncbi:MAG: CRISPR-associated protein Cas4 [Elusimicrobiota bacterium]|jgi:CRISPR-associated exonuclease Cas4|nr:CRISPR-associated protein Cas4 [Elusimicrobiota bacterium]
MYRDDELLQLSGLQHLLYCPRQCALAYMEMQWADNSFTAKGIIMHDKVHAEKIERRKNVVIERDMYIKSFSLGLVGKADVVEFHKSENLMTPFPVEYKSGKAKKDNTDKVQLCAQALCLEEMMKIKIPNGAIFYGKTKNRLNVDFDESLRDETIALAKDFHNLIESGITPKAQISEKCNNCSLKELCLPELAAGKKSVKKYLQEIASERDS